jgi:hypothetical protein
MVGNNTFKSTRVAHAFSIGSVLAIALVLIPQVASATSISVSPSTKTVSVGDSFSLDVTVTGITDLVDYQFDLNFDPTILSVTGVTNGAFLTSGGGTSTFDPSAPLVATLDNTTGLVTVLDSISGPSASGSGVLASIDFTANQAGDSPMTLANIVLHNSQINNFEDSTALIDGTIVDTTQNPPITNDVNIDGGDVRVLAPVPEPGTLLLALSGLGLEFKRRLQNRRSRM